MKGVPPIRSGRAMIVAAGALWLACAAVPGQDSRPAGPSPEQVVGDLNRLVEARKWPDAFKKLPAVRAAIASPGVQEDVRARAERLIAVVSLETLGAAASFAAKVAPLDRGLVEADYDFTRPGFEADFELMMLLPAATQPERRERVVSGTGAFLHRALWIEPLTIELTLRPRAPTDFGPAFVDPDETGTERFLTGFHNNAYFGIKYDADRSVTQGHVLLLGGRGASSRARIRPTQLLGRTTLPVIARGDQVRCSLSVRGVRAEFKTATSPTAASTLTFDLVAGTQTYSRMRPGLLFRNSEVEIERAVVRGRLDPAWSEEEKERLRGRASAPR